MEKSLGCKQYPRFQTQFQTVKGYRREFFLAFMSVDRKLREVSVLCQKGSLESNAVANVS